MMRNQVLALGVTSGKFLHIERPKIIPQRLQPPFYIYVMVFPFKVPVTDTPGLAWRASTALGSYDS